MEEILGEKKCNGDLRNVKANNKLKQTSRISWRQENKIPNLHGK